MFNEELNENLDILVQEGVITTEEKNLRSKIDSLVRSLENLSEKKIRIDFEIKRQKKSLTRKRMELKKVTKRNQARLTVALESGRLTDLRPPEGQSLLAKLDSRLLQESSLRLDN